MSAAQPAHAAGPERVPLVSFHSPSRGDFITTSGTSWTCHYFNRCPGRLTLDYRVVGLQGHVYNPNNPQPAGTKALYHWSSANRGDNFLTTDPGWAGSIGDRRWHGGADYVLFRVEGYVKSTTATSGSSGHGLYSYWNSAVADNAALATWRTTNRPYRPSPPANYAQYRYEGELLPPPPEESSSLRRCPSHRPDHTDPTSWQARGNYIDTWPEPRGFVDGDTIQLTAPRNVYRIHHWGYEHDVRGNPGALAPDGWPAPGVAQYALLGRVTSGRTYVQNRGWFEANTWFQALGRDSAKPGPCMLYNATGVAPGDLQVGFNDNNLGDNGGWANVRVQQWR